MKNCRAGTERKSTAGERGGEERRTEGGGDGGGRGAFHSSCIVNEQLFANQILFHRRSGDKASFME